MIDPSHMRAALALARRGLGTTWPNPSVGCVIVRHGRVVGRGHTAPGGRPHAEPQALAMAGEAAQGADVYVTLEPCDHTGQTPPCTGALIAARVARVIVAGSDPDRRVNGAGVARLRAAGIDVVTGVLAAEADEIQAGFLHRVRHGRPLVTLKLATTLDGRIATRSGESQWITGPAAREAVHALRGQHDAVLAGVGTVAGGQPVADVPHPRLPQPPGGPHRRGQPFAHPADRPAGGDGHHGPDLDAAPRRRAGRAAGGVRQCRRASVRCAGRRARSRSGARVGRAGRGGADAGSGGGAVPRSQPGCCGMDWWTGSPGSMLRASSAAMAGPRPRPSA